MNKITDLEVAQKLINLNNRAKSKNLPFDLSIKRVRQLLLRKTCYFTGVKFSLIKAHDNYRTIDRINPKEGYVDKNTVACTKRINLLKANLTIEEIKCLVKGITKHLDK